MTLPTQLEERFKTTLEEEAQGKKMSFMTVWERHGHEEGLREGIQRGLQQGIRQEGVDAVLEVLEERFGTQSSRLRRDLERIDDAGRLRRLLRRAVTVETLAAFEEDLGIAR
jgi:flagellar biosynthesis/type III secretory pathway protein FliH